MGHAHYPEWPKVAGAVIEAFDCYLLDVVVDFAIGVVREGCRFERGVAAGNTKLSRIAPFYGDGKPRPRQPARAR
jgi:hypothetical protein